MGQRRIASDPPRSSALVRRLRQEVGKLRYVARTARPADMTFGRFFSSAHIAPDRRYIYVKNDKVGSSFIIRSLIASEKNAAGIGHRTPFLDRHLHPLLTPAELPRSAWEEARASWFTFTYCRNPFSRILSCYLDRIAGRDESYDTLRKRIGFADATVPSFAEFLDMLGGEGVLDLDTHWKPQHRNIAVDYYDYDYLGHFEDFAETFPRLLGWLYGASARLGEVRRGTSAGSRLADYYDAHTARLVRDLYARDFALFGYDETSPLDTAPKTSHPFDFATPRPGAADGEGDGPVPAARRARAGKRTKRQGGA